MAVRGRTVLVTGGTGGIGRETARGLAALGARVVVVGRDAGRAAAAAREIGGEAFPADLTRLADLRRLVAEVSARRGGLDVLVNNFGVNPADRTLTEDGVETAFAANVLAPYVLTTGLLPALRAADGGARVVNLTGGLPDGPIDPTNLQGERRYRGWTFSHYNHTKTALMALSLALAERLAGSGVTVNVAYPGHAYTPGNRATPARAFPYVYRPLAPLIRLLGPVLLGDLAKAARSSVRLAGDPELGGVTGRYLNARGEWARWPASVLVEANREAVLALCERLAAGRGRRE
ncbi:SDR family NAD(P)-dependent oxidoreductase [Streptomyces millisiae]|uniref:SDR family NAD(P)-dependent oxidoreductase n=1 Tax=Streptomyces millisiae TaxID=3075542 RepID=UPI00374E036D